MSGFRPKKRAPKKDRMMITHVKLEDGRTVSEPSEVRRLLRLNGFIVDEETGAVTGVDPKVVPQ